MPTTHKTRHSIIHEFELQTKLSLLKSRRIDEQTDIQAEFSIPLQLHSAGYKNKETPMHLTFLCDFGIYNRISHELKVTFLASIFILITVTLGCRISSPIRGIDDADGGVDSARSSNRTKNATNMFIPENKKI